MGGVQNRWGGGEIKPFLFADDIMISLQFYLHRKPQGIYKSLLELKIKFSKVTAYSIKNQKFIVFLYTVNEHGC